MEVNEGNIRISTRPFITIGDKDLTACPPVEVAKEIQALCKVIAEQRNTIRILQQQLQESFNAAD